MTLLPREVMRRPKPGSTNLPKQRENGWQAVGVVPGSPAPVVDVQYGYVPTPWDTPEYRQDVPKK